MSEAPATLFATTRWTLVRDAAGAWIETAHARFQTGVASPMDYGFAATADGSEVWSAVERAASERAHRSKP